MRDIVINTGPLIALVAATNSLDWVGAQHQCLYRPHATARDLDISGPDHSYPAASERNMIRELR